jgi:hypothetical protein
MAEVFCLYHAGIDGSNEIIHRHEIGDVQRKAAEESEAISEVFREQSAQHAISFQTRQRYRVTAEREDLGVVGSYSFSQGVKPQNTFVNESEPSTERGLLGQLMRHNESMARINADMFATSMDHQSAQLGLMSRKLDKLEARREKIFEDVEEAATLRHIREIQMEEARADSARNQFAVQKAFEYAPKIWDHITGGNKPKGALEEKKERLEDMNGSAVVKAQEMLRDIFKVVDKKAISDCLDPDQLTALDSLLGLGEDPTSLEDYRIKLKGFWGGLPEEIAEGLQSHLSTHHPAKGFAFLDLMGVKYGA